MNIKSLFSVAALIAVSAVIAIAYLLLPEQIWSACSVTALVLFASFVGFALVSPFRLPMGKGGNAAQMATIGPMAMIVLGLLGWSGLTFLLALAGLKTIPWTMMVISVAGFLIANIVLHAVAKIVDQAAADYGLTARTLWRGQIEVLLSMPMDEQIKSSLTRLVESIQYAASDIAHVGNAINHQITGVINQINEHLLHEVHEHVQLQSLIAEAFQLLNQREVQLKAQRNKA